jgi:hypothetical protein
MRPLHVAKRRARFGQQQAGTAAAAAGSDPVGFEYECLQPGRGTGICGGHSGEPGADDDHVTLVLAAQAGVIWTS